VALGPPLLLAALSVFQPDLFEVRYFAGAVPAAVLLLARSTTAISASSRGTVALAAIVLATLVAGFADQQFNGSNPRLYDFRSALTTIEHRARPGDVIVYEPRYLQAVVAYYAPRVHAQPLRRRLPTPAAHHRVFLIASFLDHPAFARDTGRAVWQLGHRGHLVSHRERHQIRTWVFR
jgi:hypothetical protein